MYLPKNYLASPSKIPLNVRTKCIEFYSHVIRVRERSVVGLLTSA